MTQPRDTKALMAEALTRLREARERIETLEAERHGEVALVGIGLRFPGPDGDLVDLEGFWRMLCDGQDAVGPVPAERWDAEALEGADTPGQIVSREGAFLDDPALFDPQFFGISPREGQTMDPQQRLLLETTWRALEDAAIAPDSLRGSRTGVFVGISTADYAAEMVRQLDNEELVALTGTGTNHSVAAGRISYALGLNGPCLAVNTACSSSLVALHLACASLRRGECDAALVAGVNLMLSPMTSMVFSHAGMLSRDGRCKVFDRSADGYGRGEGVGVVVLKRRADAQRERDRIHACVLGAATNQDGASSAITVPNGPAQEAVIRAALADARVQPQEVGFVEAHGTGTALGDPIEMGALAAVFSGERDGAAPLAVGSIKTNLGHTEAAAGMAGLIKCVLQLEHGEVAPHLHLDEPSEHIPWDRIPLRVPTALEPWPGDDRRITGLSSFGFSGTNAHVVLGQAPGVEDRAEAPPAELVLAISAHTPDALRDLARDWAGRMVGLKPGAAADACLTAGHGRSHFSQRLAVVGADGDDLADGLTRWLESGEQPRVRTGEVHGRMAAPDLDLPATPGEVAGAFVEGLRVPWADLDPHARRGRFDSPGYPFQRERLWCLPGANGGSRSPDTTIEAMFDPRAWSEGPADGDREGQLADYLAAAVGQVLRMPADAVPRDRALTDLGLDSLMGIELRNRLRLDLGVSPPITQVLSAPSVSALAATLGELLGEAGSDAGVAARLATDDSLLREIEALSDDEARRRLGEAD